MKKKESVNENYGNKFLKVRKLAIEWQKATIMLFLYCIIIGMPILSSCSNNDNGMVVDPDEENITLSFKTYQILELKKITADNSIQDLPVINVHQYFGNRIELICPEKMDFKDNTLVITRNGMAQEYIIKWEADDLYLRKEGEILWSYCGSRVDKNKIKLNVGFYIMNSNTNQRSLSVIDQNYALESYSQVAEYMSNVDTESTSSLLWMKVNYFFE